jgi:hypothetical protein
VTFAVMALTDSMLLLCFLVISDSCYEMMLAQHRAAGGRSSVPIRSGA